MNEQREPIGITLASTDPDDMTTQQLSVALYHIAANTKLSEEFTVQYINKVCMRASTLLYNLSTVINK